jgi:UDP-N-acetyl-D-mannosaminuronate dehydrogenase
MPGYVALMAIKGLNDVGKVIKGSRVLIMGLTYKENVPDTRESPVREIVRVAHDEFKEMGQFMAMDKKPVLIDVRDSLGDISKAHAGFGYVPRYGMEDGLEETIRRFMRGT